MRISSTVMLLVVFPSAASGFCNWGPNGDAVSSTCEGGAQGGDWCNANEDQCRNGCGGNWCGSGGGGSGGGGGGSGFCNWGPNGDAASSTCQGGAQGGDWCNANSGQCEDGCGGRWCTGGDPAPPPPPPPTGDGACGPGWNEARWTTYTSYADCCENSPTYNPSADTSECSGFNACEWLGSGDSYANKKMRVKSGGKTLEVTVADTCGDSDCGGCCSTNAAETGYLVDMEYWTVMNNFGNIGAAQGNICWQLVDGGGTTPPPPTTGGGGFCNWGPTGTAANAPCDEPQGGDWCNNGSSNCESGCGGHWCT